MSLPEERANLTLCVGRRRWTDRRDISLVDPGNGEQLLLRGGVRNQHRIILILTILILSFRREHSHYFERKIAHPQHLANRIGAGEQVIDYGLTQYGNP